LAGIFLVGAAIGALSLTALHRGAGTVVHAQSPACTNASLDGAYGVLAQGYVPAAAGGSSPAAPLPRAAVLVVTADGIGTISLGGFMNPSPATGTYNVNPDCSFTVTIAAPSGVNIGISSSMALGVLVDGGKRFYVAKTDPNRSEAFIGQRQ